jgi:hypothetical protein
MPHFDRLAALLRHVVGGADKTLDAVIKARSVGSALLLFAAVGGLLVMGTFLLSRLPRIRLNDAHEVDRYDAWWYDRVSDGIVALAGCHPALLDAGRLLPPHASGLAAALKDALHGVPDASAAEGAAALKESLVVLPSRVAALAEALQRFATACKQRLPQLEPLFRRAVLDAQARGRRSADIPPPAEGAVTPAVVDAHLADILGHVLKAEALLRIADADRVHAFDDGPPQFDADAFRDAFFGAALSDVLDAFAAVTPAPDQAPPPDFMTVVPPEFFLIPRDPLLWNPGGYGAVLELPDATKLVGASKSARPRLLTIAEMEEVQSGIVDQLVRPLFRDAPAAAALRKALAEAAPGAVAGVARAAGLPIAALGPPLCRLRSVKTAMAERGRLAGCLAAAFWLRSVDPKCAETLDAVAVARIGGFEARVLTQLYQRPAGLGVYRPVDAGEWWNAAILWSFADFGRESAGLWGTFVRIARGLWPSCKARWEELCKTVQNPWTFMPPSLRRKFGKEGFSANMYTSSPPHPPENNSSKGGSRRYDGLVEGFDFLDIFRIIPMIFEMIWNLLNLLPMLIKVFGAVLGMITALTKASLPEILFAVVGLLLFVAINVLVLLLNVTGAGPVLVFLVVIASALLMTAGLQILFGLAYLLVGLFMLLVCLVDISNQGHPAYLMRRAFLCRETPTAWHDQPYHHLGNAWRRVMFGGFCVGCRKPCPEGSLPLIERGRVQCKPRPKDDASRPWAPAAAAWRVHLGLPVSPSDVDAQASLVRFAGLHPLLRCVMRYEGFLMPTRTRSTLGGWLLPSSSSDGNGATAAWKRREVLETASVRSYGATEAGSALNEDLLCGRFVELDLVDKVQAALRAAPSGSLIFGCCALGGFGASVSLLLVAYWARYRRRLQPQ